jgi:prepilin-type N-terminal cleavage/methylation domain-containing protein
MTTTIEQHRDQGFTLIEVLLVIVILGILATVVVASVGGFTAEAEESSCAADAHTLHNATEAFFAQRSTQSIPAFDASPDGYEKTLVAEGFLRSPSAYHDVLSDGQLVELTPCNT